VQSGYSYGKFYCTVYTEKIAFILQKICEESCLFQIPKRYEKFKTCYQRLAQEILIKSGIDQYNDFFGILTKLMDWCCLCAYFRTLRRNSGQVAKMLQLQ